MTVWKLKGKDDAGGAYSPDLTVGEIRAGIIKSRTSYLHDGFTVALDRVVRLGDFVEVELLVAEESGVSEAIKAIDDFASSKLGLGVESIENERYDVLIERAKDNARIKQMALKKTCLQLT